MFSTLSRSCLKPSKYFREWICWETDRSPKYDSITKSSDSALSLWNKPCRKLKSTNGSSYKIANLEKLYPMKSKILLWKFAEINHFQVKNKTILNKHALVVGDKIFPINQTVIRPTTQICLCCLFYEQVWQRKQNFTCNLADIFWMLPWKTDVASSAASFPLMLIRSCTPMEEFTFYFTFFWT